MDKIDGVLEELHNSWLDDDYEFDDPCGVHAKQAIEQLILDARIDELGIILKSPDAHDWAGQMANAVGTVAKRYNKLTRQRSRY